MTQTIPWRLRKLRNEKGLSQQEVATGTGFSLTFYHRLEKGTENPSVKSLEIIAKFFDITPSDLLSPM